MQSYSSSSRSKREGQTIVAFQDYDAFITRQPPPFEEVLCVAGGSESGEVSDPSVQDYDNSISDDNLSIMSERSFCRSHGMPIIVPIDLNGDQDDDLSISSINTKGVKLINDLKKRLRTQESTKVELLKLCLKLERKIEKFEKKQTRRENYKALNHQLRENSAKMEHDFMNAMNDIVSKMANKEEEYHEKLQWREKKIKFLEEELKLFTRLLTVKKTLEEQDASTIDTFSQKVSIISGSVISEYDDLHSREESKEEFYSEVSPCRGISPKRSYLVPSEVIVSSRK